MTSLPQSDDTIVAVSTPRGRSGIGVVRLSGRSAQALVARHVPLRTPMIPRHARYGPFLPGGSPEALDDVIVTVYPAPQSYTGEDVVEISCHGNPVILDRVVDVLVAGGARRAGPGEFTLRAVANGRLDLAQAEAVRDFINAQTAAQARTARLQLEGGLSRRVTPGKDRLIGVVAELEAGIDFADDDVPLPDSESMAARVEEIAMLFTALAKTFRFGRLLGEGFRLAVAGKPNAGKSSVFNKLIADDRAIVTEVPGTTRDVLTETVAIAGIPVRFADTAGVRQTVDRVEALGIARTLETLAEVDLTLVVLDRSRPLDADDEDILSRVRALPHVMVVNKQDLPARWDESSFEGAISVSALSGAGIASLRSRIERYLLEDRPAGPDDFVVTSARQREALDLASSGLQAAATGLRAGTPHEMVLVDLYAALDAVGELTGAVTTEDILGRVFSTFCIGK